MMHSGRTGADGLSRYGSETVLAEAGSETVLAEAMEY